MFRIPLVLLSVLLLTGADDNGCSGSSVDVTTEAADHPVVYYAGASRGVMEDEVMDASVPCAVEGDYSLCCTTGFAAVSVTAGGDVVCMEQMK